MVCPQLDVGASTATPRSSGDGRGFQTPPRQRPQRWTSPPVTRPRVNALMRALRSRSPAQVEAALKSDPSAAKYPFFEHNFELPLPSAVGCGCGAEIIRILIAYGADVNAIEAHGRSALSALCERLEKLKTPLCVPSAGLLLPLPKHDPPLASPNNVKMVALHGVATVLMTAGADPSRHSTRSPALWKLALALGDPHLAHLLQYYHEAQAYFVLNQAFRAGGGGSRSGQVVSACTLHLLDEALFRTLGCYLVPKGIERSIFATNFVDLTQ